ncbi:DUF2231 domain-containing protein [Lysobacter sp. 2RAF19]
MASTSVDPVRPLPLHPLHAFFLAAMVSPFLGAVLSDYAYTKTYEMQWSNFSSWLLAGGLVFGALAIVCALLDFARAAGRRGLHSIALLALVATWVIGLIDAFVHARDAWAVMPMGFVLSIIVLALALIATWLAFSRFHRSIRP